MMSLALSRFEFSNNKFTVYLAVPPFIPKTSASGHSLLQDHFYLFGLEPYASEIYSEQVKSILNQTEEFLRGQNSGFDEGLILFNCEKVLQRQQRSRPIQFNILPCPSSLSEKSEKPKSFKGRTNQAERSRARKLKKRQEIQTELAAKRNNKTAKSVVVPQKEIRKATETPVAETTKSKPKTQTKKRPKTHFRKTKKPGRA